MQTTQARVATDSPERYLKQLCEHLGRRAEAEYADGQGQIRFGRGSVVLEAQPGELVLTAQAETTDDLAVVADVAGRHLERFGQRHELVVTWVPDPGIPAPSE